MRNYPDRIFLEKSIKSSVYENFVEWLGGERYVYIQGIEMLNFEEVDKKETFFGLNKGMILGRE